MAVGLAPDRHPAATAPVRFTARSLAGLLAVVAVGLGFGLLLLLVRLRWGPLLSVDAGARDGLNALVAPHPAVVAVLQQVSALGGRPVMLWLVAVVVAVLAVRRRYRLAGYLTVTGLGALVLDPSLKTLVGRLRPVVADPVATAPGNSFPSGHALGSAVVYGGLLLVFLPAFAPRWRRVAIAVTALLVLSIGVTRVALGVHYVSDVLAGWLLAAAWLGVTGHAFRLWRRETGRPQPATADGLEPEAAADLRPTDAHERALPHPWTAAAEVLTGWVLVFGLLYALGMLLTVVSDHSRFGPLDDAVPQWLQTFRTPALDQLSWLWSKAGDTHAILAVSLVVCPLALAAWRSWRPVLFLVLTMVGELTLFLCTAAAVDRPRPSAAQLDGPMPTSSFPSGHIAATCCLYAAIAVLVLGRVRTRWRWLALVPAVVMPLGVALSRMYRGEHHPTDALGALLLTACWVTLLVTVVRPNADARAAEPARP